MYTVTLYNQHAQCGIKASGRYPLQAYRNALAKAGKAFTHYRGDYCEVDGTAPFNALWDGARKAWRRASVKPYGKRQSRVHVGHNGLGVELYMSTCVHDGSGYYAR